MNYILGTICKGKDGDWYILYTVRNPSTGEMKRFRERKDINRVKNRAEKQKAAEDLKHVIDARLKSGWTPWSDVSEKDKHRDNFYWWFQQRLDFAKQTQSYYNWRKLNTVYNHLKEFSPNLDLKKFDHSFIRSFHLHLAKNGIAPNGISDYFTRLRIIANEIKKDIPAFDPFKGYRVSTTDINRNRLEHEQIELFAAAKLSHLIQVQARDMYLFSYYCGGIRWGDICRLKKENINNWYLDYQMHKTNAKRHIMLIDEAKNILKRGYGEGEYLFNTGVTWSEDKTIEDKSIDARNSFFRKYLKKACEVAEIPKVSFHTARHSFADYATENDIPDKTLMQLLGHKKIQTTEKYRKSFSKEKTEEAMKKLFNK